MSSDFIQEAEPEAHDALIARLTADLRPVAGLVVLLRLLIGLGLGTALSGALTLLILGPRPDMAQATAEGIFWVKFTYTVALAALAIWVSERLARPVGAVRVRLVWMFAPVLTVVAIAAWQIMSAAEAERMPLILGGSARVCPWCIVAFAMPPLVGLIWAVRGLAPTRLRLTGLMLGLAAGGAGAAAYALHCTEAAMPFLALWYTLGIALSGAIGWLIGPRLLRW